MSGDYEKRMLRVINYIFENTDGDLSLDALADVAAMLFTGPYSGLKAAYDYLYGDWLPSSGREMRDAPSYEVYLNSPMDTAPEDLLTEICVPLA